MPASDDITEPPDIISDAESTCSDYIFEDRNPNTWFTDDDIDDYLSKNINNPSHTNIKSCIVEILASNLNDEAFITSENIHKAKIIFCPLNINNSHWILFVYCKTSLSSYFIDPIFNNRNKLINKQRALRLNIALNKLFKLNVIISQHAHKHLKYQDNNNDCGPYTCAFAVIISKGWTSFPDNFISEIREEVYSLQKKRNSVYVSKTHGGGISRNMLPKIQNIKKIVGKSKQMSMIKNENNLLKEKPCITMLLHQWYSKYSNIFILSAETTMNLIAQNKKYIIDNISFKAFENIDCIICVIPNDDIWCLQIYSVKLEFSYTFEFCQNFISDRVNAISENITDYLNKFLLFKSIKFSKNHGISHAKFVSSDPFYFASNFIILIEKVIFNRKYDHTIVYNSLRELNTKICKDISPSLCAINGNINNNIINRYFDNLQLQSSFLLIDSVGTTAIIDGCHDYISKFVDVERIKNASTIFALLQPLKSHQILLIIDYCTDEYYILNPTTLVENKSHVEIGRAFRDIINEIKETNGSASNLGKCPHDIRSSGLFSNILLCAFIKNFALDRALVNLNLREIADVINIISPIITNNPNPSLGFDKENPENTKTNKTSLNKRKMVANQLAITIENMNDVDLMENIIIQHIPQFKPTLAIRKPYLGNKCINNQSDEFNARIQFLKDMKKTVYKIINNDNVKTKPTLDDIVKHFSHSEPEIGMWDETIKRFSRTSESILELEIINNSELLNVLKRADNTTPGQDGVYYRDLKLLDPEGKILTTFYNKIITLGKIPNSWKTFKTTMIPKPDKNEEYDKISSWRPIALLSVIYKLFASILAHRIRSWAGYNNILHIGQKGGSEHDGCIEHNSILSAALEHSKYHQQSSIAIGWLDIKDAFGSVPHEYMWSLLRYTGVSTHFVNLLQSLYTNTNSFYCCGSLRTGNISIKKGVKQGCPISMILFSIAINPVLEAVSSTNIPPFMLGNSAIQTLAYADDIAVIATTVNDLQMIINKAIETAKSIGFEYRPEKCAYILSHNCKIKDEILIYDQRIKMLQNHEFYQYLGVPVGDNNDQSPYKTLEKIVNDTEKIANSKLYGWQKLKAYKLFLHSQLIFPFRTREIKIGALADNFHIKNVNGNNTTKLRTQLRKILDLSHHSEIYYFYTGTEYGGAGCTDLLDEYHTQSIVHFFRLLTSKCEYSRNINIDSMCFVVAPRINHVTASPSECLEWINGNENYNNKLSKKTRFMRLRTAIQYFKKHHNITILFEFKENGLNLHLTTNLSGTNSYSIDFRNNLSKSIHNAISHSYLEKWENSIINKFIISAIKLSPFTNKLIFKSEINEFEWNFIHKARTNGLSTRAQPVNKTADKRCCRRCQSSDETLSHVIQKCNVNLEIIKERHNACLKLITNKLDNSELIVVVDHMCSLIPESRERVDIMITNVEKKQIFLVDIKCPIDSMHNFENIDRANLEKYANLKKQIQIIKPDFKVELFTCIIGSLGSIHPSTPNILLKIGVQQSHLKMLLKSCVISNIAYSAKIWNYHKNGTIITKPNLS